MATYVSPDACVTLGSSDDDNDEHSAHDDVNPKVKDNNREVQKKTVKEKLLHLIAMAKVVTPNKPGHNYHNRHTSQWFNSRWHGNLAGTPTAHWGQPKKRPRTCYNPKAKLKNGDRLL